jgi:hypothetical protein
MALTIDASSASSAEPSMQPSSSSAREIWRLMPSSVGRVYRYWYECLNKRCKTKQIMPSEPEARYDPRNPPVSPKEFVKGLEALHGIT